MILLLTLITAYDTVTSDKYYIFSISRKYKMCPQNNVNLGQKSPLLYKSIEVLHLDDLNPRLPEEINYKSEKEILKALFRNFYLEELALSMAQNGYFHEEPLVGTPKNLPKDFDFSNFKEFIEKEDTHFIVVEGNRRLSTAMLLLNDDLRQQLNIRSWPEIDENIRKYLKFLPIIVYQTRKEILPYLGVRHITGVRKWDSYPKAYYIVKLIKENYPIKEIEDQTGDTQGSIRKYCISFKMLEQAHNEYDFDINLAKEFFSLLILSIAQGPIKRYLGLSRRLKDIPLTDPIPYAKMNELKNLLSWIFGEGKERPRVINESRDITDYLKHVVNSPEATKHLEITRDLQAAYELSAGEETMLKRKLANANKNLEIALGIAHRHKTEEIIKEIEKCSETLELLLKSVRGEND